MTYDELAVVVAASFSLEECLTKLGFSFAGSNFSELKRLIVEFKLSKSHFRRWMKSEIPFDELMTDKTRRRRLLKERSHRCEICKRDEWNGRSIPIEIDHISGNADDNRKENLRLLCPNCHAQTPTYKGKNKASASRRRRYEKYQLASIV